MPAVHTWEEWSKMFTDVGQWTPAVEAICHRESIPFHHIEPGYPGTNAVYILDRSFVVKIYAPFCHEDYDPERELYPILERNPYIPAPKLLAQGVLQDRILWPYIVMDYKPGTPIGEVRSEIPEANRVEIAASLGQIVRELRSTSLDHIRALDRSKESWKRFVQARKADCLRELREEGFLPQRVVDRIAALLEPIPGSLEECRLVLLNGDVTEDHVLVQQQNGRWHISALIDFADALIGQKEYEWIALWFGALDREAECMRAFVECYNASIRVDAAFLSHAMTFTFVHEFGAAIIRMILQRLGDPVVRSIRELQEVLWGNLQDYLEVGD